VEPSCVEGLAGASLFIESFRVAAKEALMPFDWAGVNWLAVIVAAAVGLAIGIIWYAPPVFGKRARAVGMTLPVAGQITPMNYALTVGIVLVTSYALALLSRAVGVTSIIDGAVVGFVAWLGFVATWALTVVTFEGKPWSHWFFKAGQGLASMVVMGAIIGYFM
jgi:hypothetical protein